jgi:hypothetical protein
MCDKHAAWTHAFFFGVLEGRGVRDGRFEYDFQLRLALFFARLGSQPPLASFARRRGIR